MPTRNWENITPKMPVNMALEVNILMPTGTKVGKFPPKTSDANTAANENNSIPLIRPDTQEIISGPGGPGMS